MRAVSCTLSGEQTVTILISKLKFLPEITEIHYQYCTFVDSKRFEDLVNLFAKNATIDYGPNLKCQGHTDISALFKQLRLSCENTSHHISNIQTHLSKDQISGSAYVMAWHQMMVDTSADFTVLGRYSDEFVLENNKLKISNRVLLVHGSTIEVPLNKLKRALI